MALGYNTGGAFGLFANHGVWPLIVTRLIIMLMAVWMVHALRTDEVHPVAVCPSGLILGGAIANFVDRLPDGHVTDLLDVGLSASYWLTSNLDRSIVIGVTVFLWTSLMSRHLG